MSTPFTTENIDRLRALPLDSPRGWEITFRSANGGKHHQLYLDGRLADWTDTVEQRQFVLDADTAPHEIVIAAVSAVSRAVDMSEHLPAEHHEPTWAYRASVLRSAANRSGSRIALLGDHATGQMDTKPLAVRELWSDFSARWGWGEGGFGQDGGFGFGGDYAPGLGRGTFGAGPFGIDADAVSFVALLAEEGTHQLRFRIIASNGQSTDGPVQTVVAAPPPEPPASVSTVQYDQDTRTLTLHIN